MINDFNRLKSDEYELFLPTPMFSDLIIERTLKADFIYQDVMKIECDQFFFTHVERTGAFLHVEDNHYEGSVFSVPYRIDTRHYDPGMILDGAIIFTYMGGETVVKVRVTIEVEVVSASSEVQVDEPQKTTVVTPVKAYSVQTSKKAFNINEKATVVVINHQSYPIVAKVQGDQSSLLLQEDMITVQDIGILKVSLKQSWADRFITRKYYKKPSVKEVLHLTIRHEGGKDEVEVPLTYTSYTVPVESKVITDERTYRRCSLGAQRLYNSFLINNKTSDLAKARQLLEDCMAYHTTLVDLRLFYMLILLEQKKYKKVQGQINDMLKFSHYYLEDHFDEFIDILTVLADWLAGKNVSGKIRQWPMSYYRQIFRLRVLDDQVQSLNDYETLFINEFKSTHFFAHVAGEMLKKPVLPSGPSKFYHALVTWAVSKDVLQGQWLDHLDQYYHQVIRQKVINSYDASQLYAIKSSEGILRIFVAASMEEGQCTARNHAIYLEAIQRSLLIPNLQMSYVKAACKNRLPIMFENLQLTGIYRELTRQEKAYLLTQYLEDPMTDKGPHQTMMRIYKQFIDEHSEESLSNDEKALVAYDLSEKIFRYQWSDIREGYGIKRVRQLVGEHNGLLKTLMTEGAESLGYEWFIERLTAIELVNLADGEVSIRFIDWLLEAKKEEAFSALGRQGYLAMYSEVQQLAWCHRMLGMNHPYTGELAIRLYEGGSQSPELIRLMMQTMVGSMEDEIALYNKAEIEGQYSEDFVESVLYKGVLTRLCPDQIRRIYLKYRSAKKQSRVCRHMDHYFAARVLIEEPYGYESLIEVFEEDLPMEAHSNDGQTINPVGLALMRLYQFYGDEKSVISGNLIKNAVKNGIIFPWFSDLAKPYMKTGALRKAAFFSYNSKPWIGVTLYYRSDDQSGYSSMAMKHVFFGLYIGYVVAFYKDRIQYYYEETLKDGSKRITESGIYHHQAFVSPLDEPNDYDVINTIMMGVEMKDEASVDETLLEHIRLRHFKKDAFELT